MFFVNSGQIVFVRFLEELKTLKRHFKINWPLTGKLTGILAKICPINIKVLLFQMKFVLSFQVFAITGKMSSDCAANLPFRIVLTRVEYWQISKLQQNHAKNRVEISQSAQHAIKY